MPDAITNKGTINPLCPCAGILASMIRLLDLFCGAGGAGRGYYNSGIHNILGVDNEYIDNYADKKYLPSNTISYKQINAYKILDRINWIRDNFDVIHASPPCQFYSRSSRQHLTGATHLMYPDSIDKCRHLLEMIGLPYIIENVEDAPLEPNHTIMLCGTMFPPLRVIRHRKFEYGGGIVLEAPLHLNREDHPLIFSTDWRKRQIRESHKLDPYTSFVTVAGGCQAPLEACKSAMGINWMSRRLLNQAIPPPYTQWIGRQLIQQLT